MSELLSDLLMRSAVFRHNIETFHPGNEITKHLNDNERIKIKSLDWSSDSVIDCSEEWCSYTDLACAHLNS